MKKRLLTTGLLLMCLVLPACNATDPNNLFETTEGNPADTTAATVVTTEGIEPSEQSGTKEFDGSVMFEEGYQYGNMQKNLPSGSYMRLGNYVLFDHHSGIFRLYTYDLTTGEVSSFCKDATCRHRSCAASRLLGNLEVYKGKIYTMTDNWKIAEIRDDEQIILHKAQVNGFFHHNDKLYIRTPDSSLVVLEEGSDQPRVILEEYTGYWNVIFGQYLYACASGNIVCVDLAAEEPEIDVVVPEAGGVTDGHFIYYTDEKTNYFYRCDMDGGNAQRLVDQPVLRASLNFDDEYVYYRLYTDQQLYGNTDCHDVYRFPKDDPTRIEKIITLEEAAYQVFTVPGTGKIFVHTIAAEGEERPIYVMNTDGSNIELLVIPEYYYAKGGKAYGRVI